MITITGMTPVGYIVLAGAIDRADAKELRRAATEMVAAGVTDLTIDLSRVTFLGSVGLQALTAISQLLESVAGRMVLTGATTASRRVFDIARLDRAYHIIPAALGRRSLAQRGLAGPAQNRPGPRPGQDDPPPVRRDRARPRR